ncbi:MAG: AI-2E family transporter [Acidobacteriota bacterium]
MYVPTPAPPTDASTPRSYRIAVGTLGAGASVALLYYGRVLFITVIIAFIIAFLLEPLVLLFMRIRVPRGPASFLVCSLWLLSLYLGGLGVFNEAQAMVGDLPAYGERINVIVEGAATRLEKVEKDVYRTLVPKRFQDQSIVPALPIAPPPPSRGKRAPDTPVPPGLQPANQVSIQEVRIHQEPTTLLRYAYDYMTSVYDVLLMISFVPFLVYFILSWGDHLRARLLFTLEGEPRYTTTRVLDSVGNIVRAYVVGNFLLGLALSLASMMLFASVRLPYWPLIGPLSGFLSLVPYLGMPLALLPPLIAILPMSTEPAILLFLTVSVALLHLFAQNYLYPRFVGSRVHLNPLVVTLALMTWGMLWGGIGLILAIPITASIKAVCDNVSGLESYGRLLGD